jgi:L-malate glycosyltransferase
MRLAVLAPSSSIHTRRWCSALAVRGHDVTLFTQHSGTSHLTPDGVKIDCLPFSETAGYFLNAAPLRWRLNALQPSLLHTHYASGYGTTSALVNFKPSLLSVWGSDVFEFPRQSRLKYELVRWNLRRAQRIASTSHVMAAEVQRLIRGIQKPNITPFGVNCQLFRPQQVRNVETITIGTVKTLTHVYGIDVLIRAFAILRTNTRRHNATRASRLRLLIVGDGEHRSEFYNLAVQLGIGAVTEFAGAVPHAQVPSWLSKLDVYVAVSRQESFGVAVVEASACGVPVVVSDVGGLPEVVRNGVTGWIVPQDDPHALADALSTLVVDGELRQRFGDAGRRFILENFDWDRCVDTMEKLYCDVVNTKHC